MRTMRVSLTARYVSHLTIDFGSRRIGSRRLRFGLSRGATMFHRPRRRHAQAATVDALRSLTSGYRFSSVGPTGRSGDRRVAHSSGSPRVRRA